MLVADFDFDLPPELIAQEPPAERSRARLLCLDRASGTAEHATVADLASRVRAGDLLVVNNTRVFPARLLGRRAPSGGAVECFLVARLPAEAGDAPGAERWSALVHPGQKLKPGARMIFDGARTLHGEVLERTFHGRRVVRLQAEAVDGRTVSVEEAVEAIGHVPLPPYIRRDDRRDDRERYQTMFADPRGSIAAPTAGLHFTPSLVERLRGAGGELASVTLHVGYGTFQPVRVEQVEDHRVAAEHFEIGVAAAAAINRALDEGRRVVAVGTTTTRTLEAVARAHGGRLAAGCGETDLFIYPGFEFRVVRGLLTNFHLPRSSLLMLVAAFAGRAAVLAAYREAVVARYRFYSYGDAMLIT
jgi:S-adenosylmethionine:tRNA ribosyltransferase-isomerase